MAHLLTKIKGWITKLATPQGALILVVALFILLTPNISDAAFSFLTDISGYFISKVWFGISWLIALVAGLIIGVLIIALQMILMISNGIVNSSPVQIGYPIVLSIANLGFVTAVIVISIATIIRNQTYGIKQLLTRVVIMAVMVNFGLVISGAILGFSNRITDYFLDSMTGGNPAEFATIMAQTMNPQKSFLNLNAPTATTTKTDGKVDLKEVDQRALTALGGAATEEDKAGYGALLIPIVSTLLTTVTLVIMIITLAVLIVSFLLRYIKITFYLILLPAAWMSSIFPALKSWNSKWWTNFIQQAFYPPVVIFFLWLAMRVQIGMSQNDSLNFEIPATGGFTGFLGTVVGIPLQGLLQAAVLAGLMLGGDYAGKALGVAGAGAAVKWTENVKKKASQRAKGVGLRTGLGAIAGAKQAGSWASKTKVGAAVGGFGRKITAIPVVGGVLGDVGKLAGTQARAWTARGEKVMSEAVSKDSAKDVANYGEAELLIRAERATGLERAAMLDRASKDPKLMAKLMAVPGFRSGMSGVKGEKDIYERYGFKDAHEMAMLQSGQTIKDKFPSFDEAKKKYDDAKKSGPVSKEAEDEFIKAEKEFTDAIKKLSADGANNLIFAKEKGPDGKPTDTFIMPKEEREAAMKQLITKGGWNPGTFTEFLKKAQEGNNVDEVRKLIEGVDVSKINSAAIKAMQNGAMKNLGVGGEDVFGRELFEEAKKHHGVGEDGKQMKTMAQRRKRTKDRLTREGYAPSESTLDDLQDNNSLDE